MILLAMSDAVQIAIVAMITSVIGMFVPVILIVVKDYLDRQARKQSMEEMRAMAANVKKIETQTNSLTQQLVEQTDKSANQAGRLAERARADAVGDAKIVALAVVEAEKEAKIIDVLGKPVETIAEDIAKVQESIDAE